MYKIIWKNGVTVLDEKKGKIYVYAIVRAYSNNTAVCKLMYRSELSLRIFEKRDTVVVFQPNTTIFKLYFVVSLNST